LQLLLGETSTRQAQNIIAGAAIGNGWGLPIELQGVYVIPKAVSSAADRKDRTEDDDSLPVTRASTPISGADLDHITRIKPLRESMIKEAAYYCHIRRIPTVNHRLWDRTIGSVGGQVGDKVRMKGVGEARGKGGINSLEKLTEGKLWLEDVIAGLTDTWYRATQIL
jgi:cytoplasmic tRNA 2-thiolation protein 2